MPHLAATLEAYYSDGFIFENGLVPNFWAGWGGDLATGMRDLKNNYEQSLIPGSGTKYDIYRGKSLYEISDMTIGNQNSSCNYSDICCDLDAIGIIGLLSNEYAPHEFSRAIRLYYETYLHSRYYHIFYELDCEQNRLSLTNALIKRMSDNKILLTRKGNSPSEEIIEAACKSYANYIFALKNKDNYSL